MSFWYGNYGVFLGKKLCFVNVLLYLGVEIKNWLNVRKLLEDRESFI